MEYVKQTLSVGILALSGLLANASAVFSQEENFEDNFNTDNIAVRIETEEINPILASKNFDILSQEDQRKLILLVGAIPESSQSYVCGLLNRCQTGTTESVLTCKDSSGTSLLDNLIALSCSELHANFCEDRDNILKNFLEELSQPGCLNQASWGVCGTSGVYEMYLKNPSEACRLMIGLLSPEGKVKLTDRITLERPVSAIPDDLRPGRSVSERVIMSALMEYANGNSYLYCNICDENFHKETGVVYRGLHDSDISRLQAALWGQPVSYMSKSGNQSSSLLHKLQSRSGQITPVSILWNRREVSSSGGSHTHRTNLSESELESDHDHHHASTASGELETKFMADTYHLILVTCVKDNRVYYRNLHGPTSYPDGTELQNPVRKVEDHEIGLESMLVSDFEGRIQTVFYQQDH